jgi:hypothetical protein
VKKEREPKYTRRGTTVAAAALIVPFSFEFSAEEREDCEATPEVFLTINTYTCLLDRRIERARGFDRLF